MSLSGRQLTPGSAVMTRPDESSDGPDRVPVPYSDRRFTREYIASRTERHRWDPAQYTLLSVEEAA